MEVDEAIRCFKKVHPLKTIEGYWKYDYGYILSVARNVGRTNKRYFSDGMTVRMASPEERDAVGVIPLTAYDDYETKCKTEIVGSAFLIAVLSLIVLTVGVRYPERFWVILYRVKFVYGFNFLLETFNMIFYGLALKGKKIPEFHTDIRKVRGFILFLASLLDAFFDLFLMSALGFFK